jgi:hypothetical protein
MTIFTGTVLNHFGNHRVQLGKVKAVRGGPKAAVNLTGERK